MNYFAHAFSFLDNDSTSTNIDPYFIAGAAVPDWLNVVDRKVRARSKSAKKFLLNSDPEFASLAKGIVQHHHDDDWFHQTRVFNELILTFAIEIRDLLAPDDGFRPSFLGHILVELFLDAELIRHSADKIEAYYNVLNRVDRTKVEKLVGVIAGKPATHMSWFIERFIEVRFLFDYSDDERLIGRLNQIMQRVKLPPLPKSLMPFFEPARHRVAENINSLFFDNRNSALPH